MKAIVIVGKKNIDAHQGIFESLEKISEQVILRDNEYHFYSRDGVLMTMICTLLDHEIEYSLNFTNNKVFQK